MGAKKKKKNADPPPPFPRGKLVYVDKDHGHSNVCHPSCNYACQPFSVREEGREKRKRK
jgi:hypothetical protein